ncbi:MAG: RNA polymerase sigma factor [Gemmataceae bacterium]|nr:RNA polymerase sigma factor [Gemmataceae bacterium]
MPPSPQTTTRTRRLVELVFQGDEPAREALLAHTQDRLYSLAARMFRQRGRSNGVVGPEDVLQGCLLRLHQSLAKVRPPNGRAFFGLAARQLGWILADLARKTSRPEVSLSAVTFSNGSEPGIIEPTAPDADPAESVNWVEFHSAASGLPEEIGTVFDLVYYQGLEHAEVAELLEISVRTVKRRWRHARLALDRVLHGDWPSTGE